MQWVAVCQLSDAKSTQPMTVRARWGACKPGGLHMSAQQPARPDACACCEGQGGGVGLWTRAHQAVAGHQVTSSSSPLPSPHTTLACSGRQKGVHTKMGSAHQTQHTSSYLLVKRREADGHRPVPRPACVNSCIVCWHAGEQAGISAGLHAGGAPALVQCCSEVCCVRWLGGWGPVGGSTTPPPCQPAHHAAPAATGRPLMVRGVKS
jgi:hypothetical protein